jgi:hypothetical protein
VASTTDDDARIEGHGGDAGGYPNPLGSTSGLNGGTALYTRRPIRLWNYGTIGGGGGGGQGRVGMGFDGTFYAAGGGGGAGFNGYGFPGSYRRGGVGGQQDGQDGGTDTGGAPGVRPHGPGGRGGDLGGAGRASDGSFPHSTAGAAIDGFSFVTFEITGSIVGATIN